MTRTLSERMSAAARDLQEHHADPAATFQRAVELVLANIDGCECAGISFVHARKEIDTVASTGQLAVDGDRLQYETGEGPCLDSIWEEQTTYSPDLGRDDRWPAWGPRVVEETKAQSVLSFQLFTHEDTLGALNLYATQRDAFDSEARDEGLAIAAHIAIAVSAAREVRDLSRAMDSRTVIGQATGILMERFDLDGGRAFSVLSRLSSHANVKVRDIAAEIVETRRLPARDEG
ncbi:GAF and ANTAR domain-containing protein [Nocardioides sp. SOB77]|uniref:GAF and ANTAR domain-containing protein n=1 Tax=Nocardioides oceani TaxID=3058369 RepID=A0ABT8FM67_9ACTN|nr:GAF and ANTAR domain-containing protein [Nocardioides oceani]MDN4175629.1 GAF and ANTAR domain-containing protein [Nocardioides oceani]